MIACKNLIQAMHEYTLDPAKASFTVVKRSPATFRDAEVADGIVVGSRGGVPSNHYEGLWKHTFHKVKVAECCESRPGVYNLPQERWNLKRGADRVESEGGSEWCKVTTYSGCLKSSIREFVKDKQPMNLRQVLDQGVTIIRTKIAESLPFGIPHAKHFADNFRMWWTDYSLSPECKGEREPVTIRTTAIVTWRENHIVSPDSRVENCGGKFYYVQSWVQDVAKNQQDLSGEKYQVCILLQVLMEELPIGHRVT